MLVTINLVKLAVVGGGFLSSQGLLSSVLLVFDGTLKSARSLSQLKA